jgi:hypothetical protein
MALFIFREQNLNWDKPFSCQNSKTRHTRLLVGKVSFLLYIRQMPIKFFDFFEWIEVRQHQFI